MKKFLYFILLFSLIFAESCLSTPDEESASESSSWRISKDGSDAVRKNQKSVTVKKEKPQPKPKPVQKEEKKEEKKEIPPVQEKVVPEKKNYSVMFYANGGTGSMGKRVYPEGTLLEISPNIFVRKGYMFSGWNTHADGSGKSYEDSSRILISENLELYAQWIYIVESDFVEVEGGVVNGALKGSGIFVRGRSVTIDTFYMCNHEVTQAEYEKYCCYGGKKPGEEDGSGENVPVFYTNWYDAIVYCNLRSIAEGREPVYSLGGETNPEKWLGVVAKTENEVTKYCGPATKNAVWDKIKMNVKASGYRIPTEAEWEYAARGGKKGLSDGYAYSGGNSLGNVAWYEGNSSEKAHEIRTKAKNRLGIYDMSGNVWEWCWDWYAAVSSGTPPAGADSASCRVQRGGDWFNEQTYCTVSYRLEDNQAGRDAGDGFRLVCKFIEGKGNLKR